MNHYDLFWYCSQIRIRMTFHSWLPFFTVPNQRAVPFLETASSGRDETKELVIVYHSRDLRRIIYLFQTGIVFLGVLAPAL